MLHRAKASCCFIYFLFCSVFVDFVVRSPPPSKILDNIKLTPIAINLVPLDSVFKIRTLSGKLIKYSKRIAINL